MLNTMLSLASRGHWKDTAGRRRRLVSGRCFAFGSSCCRAQQGCMWKRTSSALCTSLTLSLGDLAVQPRPSWPLTMTLLPGRWCVPDLVSAAAPRPCLCILPPASAHLYPARLSPAAWWLWTSSASDNPVNFPAIPWVATILFSKEI